MVMFKGNNTLGFGATGALSAPPLANANFAPKGGEGAVTSDLGLQLLQRIAGL